MENNKVEVKSRNGVIVFLLILVLIFAGLFTATSAYIIGYERRNKSIEADKNTTSQQDTNKTVENQATEKNENNATKTEDNNNTVTNTVVNNEKVKIENDNFYFTVPASWNCTIEKVDNSSYKVNSDDEYYEIYGNLNGEKKIAFSIMISNDTSYNESDWMNIGHVTDGRNIYAMRRFICRDNDGNNYTAADYKFEEESDEAREGLKVKYIVKNEFGEADTTKVLEGQYFIRGEAGSSARSYVYYIKDGNLLRTSLTDDFKTEVLANKAENAYTTIPSDQKIHVILGGTRSNLIQNNDEYVVFEEVQ